MVDNLWFDRMESRDRHLVARKIRDHANDAKKHPLLVRVLVEGWGGRKERAKERNKMKAKVRCQPPHSPAAQVFPEGTCVNNEYVVMFKRGAFEIGKTIVPVAIKYNHAYADAFWNSRKQSFVQHLFKFMVRGARDARCRSGRALSPACFRARVCHGADAPPRFRPRQPHSRPRGPSWWTCTISSRRPSARARRARNLQHASRR